MAPLLDLTRFCHVLVYAPSLTQAFLSHWLVLLTLTINNLSLALVARTVFIEIETLTPERSEPKH